MVPGLAMSSEARAGHLQWILCFCSEVKRREGCKPQSCFYSFGLSDLQFILSNNSPFAVECWAICLQAPASSQHFWIPGDALNSVWKWTQRESLLTYKEPTVYLEQARLDKKDVLTQSRFCSQQQAGVDVFWLVEAYWFNINTTEKGLLLKIFQIFHDLSCWYGGVNEWAMKTRGSGIVPCSCPCNQWCECLPQATITVSNIGNCWR